MAIKSGFHIMCREKPAQRWSGRREGNLQPVPSAISGGIQALKVTNGSQLSDWSSR